MKLSQAKLDAIDDVLGEWSARYYDSAKIPGGPYYVVRTSFHGGGVVSRHRTLERAALALLAYRSDNCTCGCAEIVPASEWDELPYAVDSRNPYGAARA